MSELTEAELIQKINDIDTAIVSITNTLITGGTGGAANLDYSMGNKSVKGSQRLEQLEKARALYQGMLEKIPKVFIRNHLYDVENGTGHDKSEYIGDE